MDLARGFDVRQIADALGYPAAGLGILIESAGIPFPGELMLIAAAAWAGARHLSLPLIVLCGMSGAILGSDLGYLIGWWGGRPFLERMLSLLRLNPRHLANVELFFARHGDKTILVGRFIVGLRTWANVVAGAARMPFWRFQAYSAISSVAWATVYGVLGYLLGNNWPLLTRVVSYLGWGGGVVVAAGLVSYLLLRRRDRR